MTLANEAGRTGRDLSHGACFKEGTLECISWNDLGSLVVTSVLYTKLDHLGPRDYLAVKAVSDTVHH